MGPNGQTLIRMSRTCLATPDNPQGHLKGILYELAHASSWATRGAGFAYAQQRAGIMEKGPSEDIGPIEVDISSVRAFTQGQNLALCRGRDR